MPSILDDDDGGEPPEQREVLRERLWRIIFRADTTAGRAFDTGLLVAIVVSVGVIMLDTVPGVSQVFSTELSVVEWVLTGLFTLEFFARLWVVKEPKKYLLSFFGLVDLLSILPSYLEIVFAGSHYLMTVRVLRLLRMFRVLKMGQHIGEASMLLVALKASSRKISVFLLSVCTIICIEGTLVYLVEHDHNPAFASIPQSMYWAIVTLTTVGYGDVVPVTVLGKMVASVIMLTGFAIIAVPTGVMTAELGRQMHVDRRVCRACGWTGHDPRASYCLHCGTGMDG